MFQMFLKSAAMLAKKLLDNDKLQLGDKQICLPNVIIIVLNANNNFSGNFPFMNTITKSSFNSLCPGGGGGGGGAPPPPAGLRI